MALSLVLLVLAAVLGVWQLRGAYRVFVIGASLVYILGVQAPTFTINIPLNNDLQTLDPATLNEMQRRRARDDFEPRWNRWNAIRAVWASLASILLMLLLLRM